MQSVVIIAGVGPGLGQSLAQAFHKASYKIGLISRSVEGLERVASNLGGHDVAFDACDCADHDAFRLSIMRLSQALGQPSVAIYNAAALSADNAFSMTPQLLLDRLNINVVSALVMAQVLGSQSASESPLKHLILTGGVLAHQPSSELLSLSLGKQALLTFSALMEYDLRKMNVLTTYMTITTLIGAGGTHPDEIAAYYLEAVERRLTGERQVPHI